MTGRRYGSGVLLGAFLLVAVSVLQLGIASGIGLVSDDFDAVARVRDAGWIELGGRGPLAHLAWKLIAVGACDAPGLHVLAHVAHLANALLVWWLAVVVIRWSLPRGFALALLFLAMAPGREALVWTAAHPYVGVGTCALLATAVVLRREGLPSLRGGVGLAVLLLVACAFWDTGVTIMPLAWGLVAARRPADLASVPAVVRGLGPVTVAAIAVIAARWLSASTFGYGLDLDVVRTGYYLVSAPLRALAPWASVPFFRSPVGIACALALLAGLVVGVVRQPDARALMVAFLVCHLPFALQSAPQSRYFYVPQVFLLAAVIAAGRGLRVPRLAWAVVVVLLATTHLAEGTRRNLSWRDAYAHATHIREQVDAVVRHREARGEDGALVVVNLPDSWGSPEEMWRPFLWRNGLAAFAGRFRRVESDDHVGGWAGSGIPVLTRDEILRRYPGPAAVYIVAFGQGRGVEWPYDVRPLRR